MSRMVKTCTYAPFSEQSMRLKLNIPNSPWRMPDQGGGRIIVKGYKGDCEDNCTIPKPNHCGCSATSYATCTCKSASSHCDGCKDHCDSDLERFEMIDYSGFEPDGVTLIVTKRGVGGTSALNWCEGAEVVQELQSHLTADALCKVMHEMPVSSERIGG